VRDQLIGDEPEDVIDVLGELVHGAWYAASAHHVDAVSFAGPAITGCAEAVPRSGASVERARGRGRGVPS